MSNLDTAFKHLESADVAMDQAKSALASNDLDRFGFFVETSSRHSLRALVLLSGIEAPAEDVDGLKRQCGAAKVSLTPTLDPDDEQRLLDFDAHAPRQPPARDDFLLARQRLREAMQHRRAAGAKLAGAMRSALG
ncbi:MAG: hypothetical protein H6683_08400 [Deltaproteobacteria bacterium]|nr:hypothetical protein [Deltaproteobacteria bacterium]